MNTENPSAVAADTRHLFPKLAKPESDGNFCYHVQRRISCHISKYCATIGMHPNTATVIDLGFAVAAAICFYFGYFVAGVIALQLFGVWSCVDGEVARLSGKASKLGDYYDTMVDRFAELLVAASLLLSFRESPAMPHWELLMFAYMGAVFLITNSSEKFRSAHQKNYPKKKVEGLFSWLCAGSDVRLLNFSVGVIWLVVTGSPRGLFVIVLGMTIALYFNFAVRLWKVFRLTTPPSICP